jgi:hypothetical protein
VRAGEKGRRGSHEVFSLQWCVLGFER